MADIMCVRCKRSYQPNRFPIDMGTGKPRRICLLCFSRIPRKKKEMSISELRTYESPTTAWKRHAKGRDYEEEFRLLESGERCSVCEELTELFTAPDNRRMCAKCEDRLFGGRFEKETKEKE